MVKIVGGNVLTGIQGVYTFIWAKTAQLITRAAESVRLTTTTTTSRLTQAVLTVPSEGSSLATCSAYERRRSSRISGWREGVCCGRRT